MLEKAIKIYRRWYNIPIAKFAKRSRKQDLKRQKNTDNISGGKAHGRNQRKIHNNDYEYVKLNQKP